MPSTNPAPGLAYHETVISPARQAGSKRDIPEFLILRGLWHDAILSEPGDQWLLKTADLNLQ
jgi:hypothetical protein